MKRKKNYFLFIVGNFTEPTTIQANVSDTIHTLTMVLNGGTLRYVHHDNLMVCHFQSSETLEDIDWLLGSTLNDDIFAYFLLPKPRQMGIRLDVELEKHLTDLKSKPTIDDPSIDETIMGGIKHIGEIFTSMQEEMGEIEFQPNYNHMETSYDKYTVDEILDKINERGLESLSGEEIDFLDGQGEE